MATGRWAEYRPAVWPAENRCRANSYHRVHCRIDSIPYAGDHAAGRHLLWAECSQQKYAGEGCGVATLSINYYDLGVATGKMALKVLVDGEDISKMPIEYAPQFTKEYNPEICEELGIEVPDDYVAIGADEEEASDDDAAKDETAEEETTEEETTEEAE